MKKVSILLFIFAAFIMISNVAVSQEGSAVKEETKAETTTDKDATTAEEKKADTATEEKKAETKEEKVAAEHLTKEDTALEHAEKIYEKPEVKVLKVQPRSYNDGYNTYVNDKIRFELSDIDNIQKDTVMFKINDKQEQKYTEPFTLTEEGSQVIYYYSIDKMGNKEALKTINVIVDKTAPEVLVVINAPFAKKDQTIYAADNFTYNYTLSAKDNISGVASLTYAVPGAEQKQYMKPFSVNASTPVKIEVTSEDRVGNVTKKYKTKIVDENGTMLAESVEDIQIVVDNIAPTVEIKADKPFYMKEKLSIASKDYKYTITAADAESGLKAIYYRIDNKGEFILYTGELQFYTNGLHKIEAIAKDGVGNISKTAVLDVFVDIIPADTNIKMITE